MPLIGEVINKIKDVKYFNKLDLETGLLEYKIVGEFLVDIKKEFGEEDKKRAKVVELTRLEQESKTMKEFVPKFRRVVRDSECEGRPLVKEFKKEINATICQRLIKSEW